MNSLITKNFEVPSGLDSDAVISSAFEDSFYAQMRYYANLLEVPCYFTTSSLNEEDIIKAFENLEYISEISFPLSNLKRIFKDEKIHGYHIVRSWIYRPGGIND